MTISITTAQLRKLKREAKKIAFNEQMPHSKALDCIAYINGFKNWSLLAKAVSQQYPVSSPRASKVPREFVSLNTIGETFSQKWRVGTLRNGMETAFSKTLLLGGAVSKALSPSSSVLASMFPSEGFLEAMNVSSNLAKLFKPIPPYNSVLTGPMPPAALSSGILGNAVSTQLVNVGAVAKSCQPGAALRAVHFGQSTHWI